MCILQIGKAHNSQERTQVHDVRVEKVTKIFTRKKTWCSLCTLVG